MIKIIKSPWRIIITCILLIILSLLGYRIWNPGRVVSDGSHDLKTNGIWLQHGWLGDDLWFKGSKKKPGQFRNKQHIIDLRKVLAEHNIKDLYPHLCPTKKTGEISAVDSKQTRQFLEVMDEMRVIPWVGGVRNVHVFLESETWQDRFIQSIIDFLETYPKLSGVHINIEPSPSGDAAYVRLLSKLKRKLPAGKVLSIAAYPPPTLFHPTLNVHWKKEYYHEVVKEVDQMVIMMYDTSLRYKKLYRNLIASWTAEALEWSGNTEVLLGIPVYEDTWARYHNSDVEDLENSLLGVHAGLSKFDQIPSNYRGISIYCEWEMDPEEWKYLKTNFNK